MSSSFLWCEERHWDGNPRSPYFLLFVVFGSWNLPVPFSFSPWLRVSAPQVGRPFALLHHLFSLFSVVARCVPDLRVSSSSNSSLVFRLKEPPRFLFHLLETFFIFGACFPVVSTSSQLLTRLTRELLPHRSFIFPCSLQSGMLLLGLS